MMIRSLDEKMKQSSFLWQHDSCPQPQDLPADTKEHLPTTKWSTRKPAKKQFTYNRAICFSHPLQVAWINYQIICEVSPKYRWRKLIKSNTKLCIQKLLLVSLKKIYLPLIHKVFQCYITLPLLHVFRTTLEHNSFKLIHNPRTRE